MRRELNKAILVLVIAMSMLVGTPASAQTTDPPAAPQDDSQEKQTEPDEPGTGKVSNFGDTLAQFWSVSTSIQATQFFDDNVFLSNSFRKSDTSSKLAGRVTVAYRGQHTRFEASYLPEFNLYQRYDAMNYSSHSYYQTLTHDFSRRLEMHWNLSVYRAPSRGSLPFKTVSFGSFRYNKYSVEALQDGLNLLHGDNSVGLSYRFTPRLKMTATIDGGTTYFSVRGTPAISPVTKELVYSVGGKVDISYDLNARQSVGLSLSNSYFGSLTPTRAIGSGEHQHYQSARVTYSHKLPNRFILTAAVGPGITERQGGTEPQLGVHFDVGIARQMPRYGYAVSFQRTSQVGLLQDSITGYGVNGRVFRAFGRKWRANLGGAYLRSEGASGQHQLESAGGNTQISYQLTRRITPYINYGYTHQKSLIPSPTVRNVNRNEVGIGLVYNFGVIAGQ